MQLALPLAIPWISAILLATLDGRRRRPAWLAVASLAATLAATAYLGWEVNQNGTVRMVTGGWQPGVGISLRADMLGVTFALLSTGVLLAALTFEVFTGIRSSSFPALVLFLSTGLNGVFLTADAFNFYVFFEIAMISAYVLTGYGEEARQLRSATIFAVVNLLGSAFFLTGIASLYHVTGRLDMVGIAARIGVFEPEAAMLSAVLIFIAFSVKLGIFPFHFWLPPVYTGTRPAVAAILSGAVANIGSYGLLRFGGEILPAQLELGAPVFMVLGVASIVYGSVQALSRRTVNEVLAYSSIGQVGFIMIALAIGGEMGFAAAILFAIVNAINKTLLFLSENLRGWPSGFVFVVGALSVAGIPPVGGYLSKAGLFRVAVSDHNWLILGLMIIGSALSFIYMFQVYQWRYWSSDAEDTELHISSPATARGLVAVIAVLTIAVGVWPEPALWVSEQAAQTLRVVP
ncbi:MAG: complex I subunit 5 family protein [Thermomicrobiales bacterium]